MPGEKRKRNREKCGKNGRKAETSGRFPRKKKKPEKTEKPRRKCRVNIDRCFIT